MRLIGGWRHLAGVVMMGVNTWKTIRSAAKDLPDPAFAAPRRVATPAKEIPVTP